MKAITLTLIFNILILATQAYAEFKVGVVAPLSGSAASSGVTIRNSIILASKRFDATNSIEFIFEDDQLTPKNTVSAVNKLIEVNHVNALVIFGTPTSLAVNSIAEAKKTPMIALSIVDKVVAGKSFVFKHWVTAQKETELITSEVNTRGYKKIAVVSTINDAMLKLRDLFKQQMSEKIVLDEEFNKDDLDFRAAITKVIAAQPEAIYVLLWSPQLGVFARQLRSAGYRGPLFGVHNMEDPKEIEASGEALVGSWLVTGDDRNASRFYKEYFTAFQELPSAGGVNAYDVAKILIEGVKSSDLPTYLRTLKSFSGAYGTYSATGYNDFEIPATIKVIEKDGIKFVEEP